MEVSLTPPPASPTSPQACTPFHGIALSYVLVYMSTLGFPSIPVRTSHVPEEYAPFVWGHHTRFFVSISHFLVSYVED